MCANHGVAYRKALAWLGHSNSEMLDLYYHLHDDSSRKTMMELAKSETSELADDDFENKTAWVESLVALLSRNRFPDKLDAKRKQQE